MKKLILAALCLSLAACFTIQVRPIPFRGPTPDLGLTPEQKLPLHVAVVIPDPMGFRYYLSLQGGRGHSVRQDQTEHFGGEKYLPIPEELARLAAEAFPGAFQSVSVLRQLPPPGEYDAVVVLAVAAIEENFQWGDPLFGAGGTFVELSLDWKLSVLGKGNVELLSIEDSTGTRRFHTRSHTFTDEVMAADVGREGGLLLSSITRRAVRMSRDMLVKAAR